MEPIGTYLQQRELTPEEEVEAGTALYWLEKHLDGEATVADIHQHTTPQQRNLLTRFLPLTDDLRPAWLDVLDQLIDHDGAIVTRWGVFSRREIADHGGVIAYGAGGGRRVDFPVTVEPRRTYEPIRSWDD
jgi:hypothetical protein